MQLHGLLYLYVLHKKGNIDFLKCISVDSITQAGPVNASGLLTGITVIHYSKNLHKRTSGLRTLRLKFGQKDTICIRTHLA